MENTMIIKNGFRITVITDRLLRVETEKMNRFIDMPTQKVVNRDFSCPEFSVYEDKHFLTIETKKATFTFDKRRLRISKIILAHNNEVYHFSKGNLKGTRRTLDNTNGWAWLDKGLVSKNGVSVLDDSKSLLLREDASILPRESTGKDLYFFAYGHDYRACIQDFFKLCGQVPLIPRFALGNWWSRYKAYTQSEYLVLMQRFIDERIPITVATVDMDWHWVDVKSKFGNEFQSGWTGYSWNTDLFPDYRAFLQCLHENNFKVTVNLHPADGVRAFETMYADMAKEMGVTGSISIPFNIADPRFVAAYFKVLHHPYEETGVNLWWIDWQQGKKTKIKGLDPLWALNYFHFNDNGRNGKRPLILSRYAGIGSHRFPLGFSGDTTVSWRCLAFQPYFTANATNAGYTWWSHDIGGHHKGRKDDELYLRWLQFGVFSPINRLHSTNNEFMGKEPWKFRQDVRMLAVDFLRLRHRLIPYLYAMNHRTHRDGIALIEPMYYAYPEAKEAYQVKNQYQFGSELIVAPITEKLNPKTNLAHVRVWLPAGRYTDIFNGFMYEGGRYITMHRGLESIPVLAKAGAILPLADNAETNDWQNPAAMTIQVYRGSNTFILYEDNGEDTTYLSGSWATTSFTVSEADVDVIFRIHQPQGDASILPLARKYAVHFKDIIDCENLQITSNRMNRLHIVEKTNGIHVLLPDVTPNETIEIRLNQVVVKTNGDVKEQLIECISKFQCRVSYKKKAFTDFVKNPVKTRCRKIWKGPIEELLQLKR